MIDATFVHIQNGYAYIRKHPQLLTTLFLIVFIPVAFLVSGQQFLTAARDNQERLEKERIGIFHDLFASLLQVATFDASTLQAEIEEIAIQNPDINDLRVVHDHNNKLTVIAALNTELIGVGDDEHLYHIASVRPGETVVVPAVSDGVRLWHSYRLMQATTGERYYVFLETSLEHIDQLFAARIMSAYYWLAGILLIVLLLVIRHVRLIDYAYLYRETKKANEMKDLFTNMIAHELRAPLTAMRGYASMIREQHSVQDETLTYATRIEEAADRLVLLINDLLDVARIQSGKLSIQPQRVDAQKIIASALETMQGAAKEKHITLEYSGAKNVVYALADEKRLHQALVNLVSNAIKYTKAGTIRTVLTERADRVEVRVEDTGMGISADDQKNLFAPFFRAENVEVGKITGTGLGMWITKQLIELMQGSIGVESIRGVGTHVVITLKK